MAQGAEIRGLAVDRLGHPITLFTVTITRTAPAPFTAQSDLTGERGAYRLLDLPPGEYDLVISAYGGRNATIRSIAVDSKETRLIPTIEMEWEPFISMSSQDPSPLHYRLAASPTLAGIITDAQGNPLSTGTVNLYQGASGKLATTRINPAGTFSFPALRPGAMYWISISAPGYFDDELSGLTVQAGFEAVYMMRLEPCAPGRCQPHLKTITVHPGPL